MIEIKCNLPTYFDVDGTLIEWGYSPNWKEGALRIECEGITWFCMPITVHVEQLKCHAARGHTVIVWSKGGEPWAKAVVKALNLEQFVTVCLEKPRWFYDDEKPAKFMGPPQFLKKEKS